MGAEKEARVIETEKKTTKKKFEIKMANIKIEYIFMGWLFLCGLIWNAFLSIAKF